METLSCEFSLPRKYCVNFLFLVNTAYISYKVARDNDLRLNSEHNFAGYPMALILNHVILYYFNIVQENSKAILASLSPALFIIPKAVARLYTKTMEGPNYPSTSFLLLMPLTAAPPIMFRILQANLHGFWMYLGLSIVHGIESNFDKIRRHYKIISFIDVAGKDNKGRFRKSENLV